MADHALWMPTATATEDVLLVDAAPASGQPVLVHTTQATLWQLVEQLRAEPNARRVEVSNRAFRACVSFQGAEDPASRPFQRFCGDVLVLYCARFLLDGRGVPCRAVAQSTEEGEGAEGAGGEEAARPPRACDVCTKHTK